MITFSKQVCFLTGFKLRFKSTGMYVCQVLTETNPCRIAVSQKSSYRNRLVSRGDTENFGHNNGLYTTFGICSNFEQYLTINV